MKSLIKRSTGIKAWHIRKELSILYFAFIDRRTPLHAKIPALLGVIYLISPIDIIPDFIPVIGYVDDLLIVPLMLNVSIRLLPLQVLEASEISSLRSNRKIALFFWFAILVVIILMIAVYLLLKRI